MAEAAAAVPVAAPVQQNTPPAIPDSSSQSKSVQVSPSDKGGQNSPPLAEKVSTPPAPEMFEVTVDGKSVKWTKAQVLAYASKAHVADKKFEEASQLRKSSEKLIELAKKDPIAALLDPSLNLSKEQVREAIENYYNREYIEPETLTPEQRELNRYRQEAQERQETEKQAKARQEQEQNDQLTTQHREILQKQIISALEASGLPKTAFYASRMAFHMAANMKNGWEAPQDLIIEQVKNEHNSIFGQFKALPAEEIIKVLGDEFVNKIRQHDLQKLRESRGKLSTSFGGKAPAPLLDNSRKQIDMTEVNDRMRRMKMGEW